MGKANPKAWFTSPIARISYRAVDKWAVHNAKYRPYFDTWAEAQAWMLAKTNDELVRAERDAKSARNRIAKLQAMIDPTETKETS